MNFLKLEITLSWIIVLFYALTTVFWAFGLFWNRAQRIGWWPFFFGFALHTLLLAWRWYEVSHGPYVTPYEVFSSNAWVIVFLFLILRFRWPLLTRLGVGPAGAALFFMLLALQYYDGAPGIPTAYHYFWLAVHVIFTKLSLASIFIALGASVAVLIGREAERAEKYIFRFTGLTLCFWTVSVAAGAVWANLRWGRYWGWDPIETWSLIVWLGLGLSLHLQKTLRWRGRRAAWLTVGLTSFFIFVLVLLPFVTRTVHTMYLLGGEN